MLSKQKAIKQIDRLNTATLLVGLCFKKNKKLVGLRNFLQPLLHLLTNQALNILVDHI